MNTICHLLRPNHPNHRLLTQSKLQSLRCFSPFFIQRPLSVVYHFSHVISWSTESWILTYCLPYLDFPSLTAYTYFPTSESGYFPPLVYFRTSRLGSLLFHGAIFTSLVYPSMSCITSVSSLTALTNAIVFLFFFAVDRVTRNIFKVRLLVPCWPVLLETSEVISGVIRCDKMRGGIFGGSATASLNRILLCSVYFILVGFVLFTWGVDCSALYLSFICLFLDPATFEMNI